MKTSVGCIQPKDYLPKPEPFFHSGVPIWNEELDKYQLGWEEDADLKAKYELDLKLAVLNEQWLNLPKGIQSFFKTTYLDIKRELLYNNKEEAVQILMDIEPLIPDTLKSVYQTLLQSIQDF